MGTDIHSKLRYKNYNKKYVEVETPPYFEERQYDFFAILADVRNGYGFAGSIRYVNKVQAITKDRGFPNNFDLGDEYLGDHSFGYVTLKELKETKLHNQKVIGMDYNKDEQPFKEKIEKLIIWMELFVEYKSDKDEIQFIFGFDS